jgi:hypothetical protein
VQRFLLLNLTPPFCQNSTPNCKSLPKPISKAKPNPSSSQCVVQKSEPPSRPLSKSFLSLANENEGKSFLAKSPLINHLFSSKNQWTWWEHSYPFPFQSWWDGTLPIQWGLETHLLLILNAILGMKLFLHSSRTFLFPSYIIQGN